MVRLPTEAETIVVTLVEPGITGVGAPETTVFEAAEVPTDIETGAAGAPEDFAAAEVPTDFAAGVPGDFEAAGVPAETGTTVVPTERRAAGVPEEPTGVP